MVLERNIDQGKLIKEAADRNLQMFHTAFHSAQEKFESFFNLFVCSQTVVKQWTSCKKLKQSNETLSTGYA